MARFRCKSTFTVPPDHFVLSGDVLSGTIDAGMNVLIPVNKLTSFAFEIHSVELVNTDHGTEVGLVLKEDADVRDILDLFDVGGEELVVEMPA